MVTFDPIFAGIYYMKETDLGSDENKDSYWDNDTVYKVVVTINAMNADGTMPDPESTVEITVLNGRSHLRSKRIQHSQ